jgi:hypothetical protein
MDAIAVDAARRRSVLPRIPPSAVACYVLAQDAGAGMEHPFMEAVADGLAPRDIGAVRSQFPFMELGSKHPERPEETIPPGRRRDHPGGRYLKMRPSSEAVFRNYSTPSGENFDRAFR